MPEAGQRPPNEQLVNFILRNWLLNLLKEIRRTYEYARREYGLPVIDQIFLSGEGALVRHLDEYIHKSLGVTTSVFDPVAAFESPAGLYGGAKPPALCYAACAGAVAADASAVSINLLPEIYRQKTERKRQQQSWVVSGILALVLLALSYVYVANAFADRKALLASYAAKNKEMKTRVADLKAKETRLDIISRFIQDEHGALDILERISSFSFIPSQVTLLRVEYRKEEYIKITGHAKTLPDVNRMKNEIEQTGFFQSVTLDEGSNKQVKLQNRTDQVLEYYITATFPKRGAKRGAAAAGK